MKRIQPSQKIYVAGHRGMVGSAMLRCLAANGYESVVTASRREADLRDPHAVQRFFEQHQPDVVVMAAAKVGGIWANKSFPAQFIYDNLMIEANVLHQAYLSGVKSLLFLGSSCIYPKQAETPIKESQLLTGPLEESNRPYAIAKIAGIELCESYNREYGTSFIPVMPCNLYGPNDNYDLAQSHVLPALIRKFHEAKVSSEPTVSLWGTGTPLREFLHVDDLAAACLMVLEDYDETGLLNIGSGSELSIKALAELVASVVGYNGQLQWDTSKPDGTYSKVLDVSRLAAMGYQPRFTLEAGIQHTYADFLTHLERYTALANA